MPIWVGNLSYPKYVDFIPEITINSSYDAGVAERQNQLLWKPHLQLMKDHLGIPNTSTFWTKDQISILKTFYKQKNPKKIRKIDLITSQMGPYRAEREINLYYGSPFINLKPKTFEFMLKKGTILFHTSPLILPFSKIKLKPGFLFFGLSSLISLWYAVEKFTEIPYINTRKIEDFETYLNIYRLEQDLTVQYIDDDISSNQEHTFYRNLCNKNPCLHPQFGYHSFEQLITKRGPVDLDWELTIPTNTLSEIAITPLAVYHIDVLKLLENSMLNIDTFNPVSTIDFNNLI